MMAHMVRGNQLMVLGDEGVGKSKIAREVCLNYMPRISQKYQISQISFNSMTKANFVYSPANLVPKRSRKVRGPSKHGNKIIFLIDDYALPHTDNYGVKSANEVVRSWMDHSSWYDHNLDLCKILDIQFLSLITTQSQSNNNRFKSAISSRNEWHWSFIHLEFT